MSEVGPLEDGPGLQAESYVAPGRLVLFLSRAFLVLAALGIAYMAFATVYDVTARYVFNSPTSWATETSTYALLVTVFLGAAYTHLADANVRIKAVLDRLRPDTSRALQLVVSWIAFLYVATAGWQAVILVISDYDHGARIFSLLLTPSWLPKLPIAFGLCLLAAALVAEIDLLSPASAPWRRWAPYVMFTVVAIALVAFGVRPPLLPGTRFDLGSAVILAGTLIGAFVANGPRVGAIVTLIAVAWIALFLEGRALGPGVLTGLLFLGIIFFLMIGMRVAFALAMVGLLSVYFLAPLPFPLTLADRTWAALNSFSLTAVPLKVLMATILVRSGLTNELFSLAAKVLRPLSGGLAHAATAGCAIFAAVSGSSVATAATIGTVACPEMIRRGYSVKLAYGTVAAGGTLGILMPPSIALIIYSTTVGVPVTKLFLAGIAPGILMIAAFMSVIFVWTLIDPEAAPAVPKGEGAKLSRTSVVDAMLVMSLIGVIIVALYGGVATATETGAVGVLATLLICLFRGRLSWTMLSESLRSTVTVTSFIFMIVVGASVLTYGFDLLKLSQRLMEAATATHFDRWFVFLMIAGIYIALGAFLDSISMLVLTLPVVFPVITALGFDPLWFGIVLMILAEVGLIHPPVGMNLFILQGIGKTVSMRTITLGALPFLIVMFVTVLILCLVPEIVLFIPQHSQ